jgi:mono/diheme cytochrome c family protein
MRGRRSAEHVYQHLHLPSLLTFCAWGALSLYVYAQMDTSRPVQSPAKQASSKHEFGTASQALYERHCLKCHGPDGRGREARDCYPDIPDFSSAEWQGRRTDAQLLDSIVNGKGKDMPRWSAKLSNDQARALMAYVRAFSPHKEKRERPGSSANTTSDNLDDQFRRLEAEFAALQKEFREPSVGSGQPAVPSQSARSSTSVHEAQTRATPLSSQRSDLPAAGKVDGRATFLKSCARCHGEDGTGNLVHDEMPTIPNFTIASWQAGRSDAQLLASILEGKRKNMPAWRGKIGDEQARALVAYVRAFPKAGKSRSENSHTRGRSE